MSESPGCPHCNLPKASEYRSGSLTSFLFVEMHCQCNLSNNQQFQSFKNDRKSCKRCGKVISAKKRKGSFTAFLLSDLRCNCPPMLQQAGEEDPLSTKFKQSDQSLSLKRRQRLTTMRTNGANIFTKDAGPIVLQAGDIIGGCYKLGALIGKGGMGVVYKANHISLNRQIALKFIAPSMVSTDSWELFKREAKLNSTLSHPSVCQIYDLGIHAGALPFYAMDYIEGQTLEDVLLLNGPLSLGATLELFIKIAGGISYAHRKNIVHKDIKPANIMLTKSPSGIPDIRLLDFGIAELSDGLNQNNKGTTQTIIGSAAYMSPEQFLGLNGELRSDIYSIGCTIFETLTNLTPFQGESFSDLQKLHTKQEAPLLSEVTGMYFPLEIEAVIQKCLAKNPDNRYQNASELAIDLQRILSRKSLQFANREYERLKDSQSTYSESTISHQSKLVDKLKVGGGIGLLTLALSCTAYTFFKSPTTPPAVQLTKDHNSLPTRVDSLKPSGTELSKQIEQETYRAAQSQLSNSIALHQNTSKPIKPITVKTDNSDTYTIEFDRSDNARLGSFVKSPGTINIDRIVTCSSPASFSQSANLLLMPDRQTADPKNLVKRFAALTIRGICCTDLTRGECDFIEQAIKEYNKLELIILGEHQDNQAILQLLSQVKNETTLLIWGWDKTNERGAQLESNNRIKHLFLDNCKGRLSDFFKTKPEDSTITQLKLLNTPLIANDLSYLARFSSLQSVKIVDCRLTAQNVLPLLQSKSLTSLSIFDTYFDIDQLDCKAMAKATNLKYLQLNKVRLLTQEERLKIAELEQCGKVVIVTHERMKAAEE